MITVASLWRHPIKSHGREALDSVTLDAGKTMPWDRHWAVTHQKSKFDTSNPEWVMCRNFMIGNLTPDLAGIWASFDDATQMMTLRHADLGEITFNPDTPADFLKWVAPLSADQSISPTGLVTADVGMTDSPFASISLMNTASHLSVAQQMNHDLEPERWRGNIWLDGLPAWEERDLLGKTIRIGTAQLDIKEHIVRCGHTKANPHTGKRDLDTLAALQAGWGHQEFGVYAIVSKSGRLTVGDKAQVL